MNQSEIDEMYSRLTCLSQDGFGNRLYSDGTCRHWCRNIDDVIVHFGNVADYQI